MATATPTSFARFERLGQEELLRMEHLFTEDKATFDRDVARRAGLFEAHVAGVCVSTPENGMVTGKCPKCGATSGVPHVIKGLWGSIVSGRWICSVCKADGCAEDLAQFPCVLSVLEPGGWLTASKWFFRGPTQAQAEGDFLDTECGAVAAYFVAAFQALAPDWDRSAPAEELDAEAIEAIVQVPSTPGPAKVAIDPKSAVNAIRSMAADGRVTSFSGALSGFVAYLIESNIGNGK